MPCWVQWRSVECIFVDLDAQTLHVCGCGRNDVHFLVLRIGMPALLASSDAINYCKYTIMFSWNAGVDRPTQHQIASLTLNLSTKNPILIEELQNYINPGRHEFSLHGSTQASLTFIGTLLPTQRHLASLGLAWSGSHQQRGAETSPGHCKRDRCHVVVGCWFGFIFTGAPF